MGSSITMFKSLKEKSLTHIVLLGSSSVVPPSTSSMIWQLPTFLLGWIRPLMSSQFVKMAYHETTDIKLIESETTISKNNELFVTQSVVLHVKWPTHEEMKKINIKCLNIIGETDGLMPIGKAKEITKLIPNCEEVIIKNSSHNLMLEQPKDVNECILKFINL